MSQDKYILNLILRCQIVLLERVVMNSTYYLEKLAKHAFIFLPRKDILALDRHFLELCKKYRNKFSTSKYKEFSNRFVILKEYMEKENYDDYLNNLYYIIRDSDDIKKDYCQELRQILSKNIEKSGKK